MKAAHHPISKSHLDYIFFSLGYWGRNSAMKALSQNCNLRYMAHKERNPHGCSNDGDPQSHPDRKNCTSARLNQKSLSKLKCGSYLHLHLLGACTLTVFDVLNTLYMHLMIISLKYNLSIKKKKEKKKKTSSLAERWEEICTSKLQDIWGITMAFQHALLIGTVCPLHAGGPNGKLELLASRKIMSPQWLAQSKAAFWHTERYRVHAWIVKMNKELNRNKTKNEGYRCTFSSKICTLCPGLTSFTWCLLSSRKFFSMQSLQLSPDTTVTLKMMEAC